MKRIAVIGASAAGIAAAQALREEGFDGALTLVGGEPHAPYDRTALSKDLLLGTVALEDIALVAPMELTALDAEWRLGRHAVQLRPSEQIVELDDGSVVPYDGLVLATGSVARRLPFATPSGVHHLRELEDAWALDDALRAGRRVVLVGGGFVGLELAAVASTRGCLVTVLESGVAPLAAAVGVEVGGALAARHRAHGVEIRTGAAAAGFTGGKSLTGVALADGEIVGADVALVGIGAAPNVGWLAGSGLGGPGGVDADERLATAAPGVVVAGDLARWRHPGAPGGALLRIEHFEHAQASGAAAALRLLHGEGTEPYAPVPFVWSHQYEHVLHVAGFPSADVEVAILEGELADGPFVVEYRRAGNRIAVLALDDPRSFRRHRRTLNVNEGALA